GKRLPAPEPTAARPRHRTVFLEKLQQLLDVSRSQPLVVHEWKLEQPRLQMRGEQEQVVGIDEAFLGIGAEEIFGMADDELVERRAGRDKHAHRPRPSYRAAQLLPVRRDGPRLADQHRALQAPDVDAQLERVGADDRGHVAVALTLLYVAPFPPRGLA